MLRLIVLNGSGQFKGDSVNLSLQTFDVENPGLEKLVKATTSNATEFILVGIEIVAPPPLPPQPITQPVIVAGEKTQPELIEDLRGKHKGSLMTRLHKMWNGKPKPLNLP